MRRSPGIAALLAFVAAAGTACAQAPARSQPGTVSQRVGDARITIAYKRPAARGRALFGALVPWGEVWTPSADSAAVFETSAPLTLNGARLPAGRYGVWAIPDSATWTIIFTSSADAFHLRYPAGHDVLRVPARVARGERVETLLFSFPMVDGDSATLELRWGETVVPMRLRAAPR